jgi:hypothetical protein
MDEKLKKLLASETQPEEKIIHFKGDDYRFLIRPLPWGKKNQLISKAMTYNQKGDAKFDLGNYLVESLSYMIVEAPWPANETKMMLVGMNAEFGAKLEELVPKAIVEETPDFFEEASEESSEEEE